LPTGKCFPNQTLAALQDHISGIVPEAIVEAEVAMFTAEDEDRLLAGNPDFVVDAIDDIDTKVSFCLLAGLMGEVSLQVAAWIGSGSKQVDFG